MNFFFVYLRLLRGSSFASGLSGLGYSKEIIIHRLRRFSICICENLRNLWFV